MEQNWNVIFVYDRLDEFSSWGLNCLTFKAHKHIKSSFSSPTFILKPFKIILDIIYEEKLTIARTAMNMVIWNK